MLTVYAGHMAVDHDSPVPLYRQVAAELRRRIADEGLMRLPSLVTICQEYEVSRPTAEAAVKLLVDAGEAYVVPGKGTYVRAARRGPRLIPVAGGLQIRTWLADLHQAQMVPLPRLASRRSRAAGCRGRLVAGLEDRLDGDHRRAERPHLVLYRADRLGEAGGGLDQPRRCSQFPPLYEMLSNCALLTLTGPVRFTRGR